MSDEYPKWLADKGVVAQSKDEEDALSDGRAEVVLAHRSAEGDTYKIAYKPVKPKKAEPEPEPKPEPAPEPPKPKKPDPKPPERKAKITEDTRRQVKAARERHSKRRR